MGFDLERLVEGLCHAGLCGTNRRYCSGATEAI